MRDRREREEDTSLRRSHSAEQTHSRRRSRSNSIDGGNPTAYDIPVLSRAFDWPSPAREETPPRFQPRFSAESTVGPGPSFSSSYYDNQNLPGPSQSQHEYSDPRYLLPQHHPESHYGRHRLAPLYSSDEWDRRGSLSNLPPPGTVPDGPSNRVVLPPVSQLLGTLGLSPDRYEQGPILPQLRLPEPHVTSGPMRMGEDVGGDSPATTMSTSSQPVRNEGMDGAGDGEGSTQEKRRVTRKIYVACDFCRGRKLRCDGGRPCCSNCETRSLACKYQEHPRRRGPGKAPKGTRSKRGVKKKAEKGAEMAGPSTEGIEDGGGWRTV